MQLFKNLLRRTGEPAMPPGKPKELEKHFVGHQEASEQREEVLEDI